MIAVVADDLTGAAELAGIAWSYGLTAEVQTVFSADTTADVVAVDTDSRAFDGATAAKLTAAVFRAVAATRPEWIYKKCDSVLRGHPAEEIEAALKAIGWSRALLIPANPSRGRTIQGGEYFIGGRRLSETDFAADPDFPRRSSAVSELVGGRAKLLGRNDPLGENGIFVPEISTAEELEWAARVPISTLVAGAADFFEVLLKRRRQVTRQPPGSNPPVACEQTLFVCGSAMAWGSGRSEEALARNIPVINVAEIAEPYVAVRDTVWGLSRAGGALMGCGGMGDRKEYGPHHALLYRVRDVIESSPVRRICIEGGATARRLASLMRWKRFEVVREWAAGVVELRVPGDQPLSIVVKVGSYRWPEEIWPA